MLGVCGSGFWVQGVGLRVDLTSSVLRDISQKSIPTQIRQLILYISNIEGQVDGFVGVLTSAKRR